MRSKVNRPRKTKTQNRIEQFYIIRIENRDKHIDILDFAFHSYSESRRMAQKLVRRKNNFNLVKADIFNEKGETALFKEIIPDYWYNGSESITIYLISIKQFKKNKFFHPKKKHLEIPEKLLVEEIYM